MTGFWGTKDMTLIEPLIWLVISIVVAGAVLFAIEMLNSKIDSIMKDVSTTNVRSAYATALVQQRNHTSVKTIARLATGAVLAKADGVEVKVDGTNYIVQTFKDEKCEIATKSSNDRVGCIKGLFRSY